jgi:signal transduction histidine kinase
VAQRTGELSLRVQKEVAQLNSTLTNFLDFALPRKEGYSHFPLRGLVEELLAAHDEQVKVNDIVVELNAPPASATIVEADRHLMHQAIRNILVNAIQLLSASVKKTIRIEIKPLPKDSIRLSIADSGPGITQENLPRIFDVFYSTRKGGSGFGLAIARKILEEHQGKLWAENNVESRGAVFIMELPRFAPQEEESTVTIAGAGTGRKWTWRARPL